MSFPQYPEYKDSGVEWLGEVPVHWKLERSDAYIDSMAETVSADRLSGKEVFHYSIPVVQETGDGRYEDGGDIESSKVLINENQVLVSKLNPRKGTVCLAAPQDVVTVCSGEFVPLSSQSLNLDFLLYLVRTTNYRFRLESMVESATRSHQRASPSDIAKFRWAFPPESEQATITAFLDHETARIDALVEQQQRLIELLKEKRQAVISHVITKGLDPDVPMKDSGVEWLGELPTHWEVKPLRHLGECQNGINIGAEAFGTGFPFISYGDVYKNEVLPTRPSGLVQSSGEDREKYSIEKGDVFFTRTSETVEEIGFSSTCFQDIPSATFAGFLIRFRPAEGALEPKFSRYYFGSRRLREFFVKEMEIVTRASLGQDLLKRMSVPIPSVEEQIRIAQHLDVITQKIDSLLDQARAAIKLLEERRSAMISAAVTGKIDVRGWQPPAGSSARAQSIQTEAV